MPEKIVLGITFPPIADLLRAGTEVAADNGAGTEDVVRLIAAAKDVLTRPTQDVFDDGGIELTEVHGDAYVAAIVQ